MVDATEIGTKLKLYTHEGDFEGVVLSTDQNYHIVILDKVVNVTFGKRIPIGRPQGFPLSDIKRCEVMHGVGQIGGRNYNHPRQFASSLLSDMCLKEPAHRRFDRLTNVNYDHLATAWTLGTNEDATSITTAATAAAAAVVKPAYDADSDDSEVTEVISELPDITGADCGAKPLKYHEDVPAAYPCSSEVDVYSPPSDTDKVPLTDVNNNEAPLSGTEASPAEMKTDVDGSHSSLIIDAAVTSDDDSESVNSGQTGAGEGFDREKPHVRKRPTSKQVTSAAGVSSSELSDAELSSAVIRKLKISDIISPKLCDDNNNEAEVDGNVITSGVIPGTDGGSGNALAPVSDEMPTYDECINGIDSVMADEMTVASDVDGLTMTIAAIADDIVPGATECTNVRLPVNPLNVAPPPPAVVLVDKLGSVLDSALVDINSQKIVGLACQGMSIGREGTLCFIQISVPLSTYIFDILSLGLDLFDTGLRDVLESTDILKVVYDCRCLSDILYAQYNVVLNKVFDCQVADVMLFRSKNDNKPPQFVGGVSACILNHLRLRRGDIFVQRCRAACRQEDESVWAKRPVTSLMLDAANKNVMYLCRLRVALIEQTLADMIHGTNIYLSIVRQRPDDDKYVQHPENCEFPPQIIYSLNRSLPEQTNEAEDNAMEFIDNSDSLTRDPCIRVAHDGISHRQRMAGDNSRGRNAQRGASGSGTTRGGARGSGGPSRGASHGGSGNSKVAFDATIGGGRMVMYGSTFRGGRGSYDRNFRGGIRGLFDYPNQRGGSTGPGAHRGDRGRDGNNNRNRGNRGSYDFMSRGRGRIEREFTISDMMEL